MPCADQSLPGRARGWAFLCRGLCLQKSTERHNKCQGPKPKCFHAPTPLVNCRSPAYQLFMKLRIPGSYELDVRGSAFDGAEIFRRQFDVHRADVLVQAM